jgi:Ca2+/H+ antiporter
LTSNEILIALTIPVVSVFSILTERPLSLGLDAKGMIFLVLLSAFLVLSAIP